MPGQIVLLMVTALIERKKKFLILQRSEKNRTNKNKWQFVEGKVKFGENLLKALKRELKEETNLELVDAKLVGISSSILKTFRMLRIIFKCRVKGRIKLSEDHKKYKWVSRKKLKKMDFIKGFDISKLISKF